MKADCRCKVFKAGGGKFRLQCSDVAIATPYDRTWSYRMRFLIYIVYAVCSRSAI